MEDMNLQNRSCFHIPSNWNYWKITASK